jgi:ketosteroid isomerase-like protein
MNKIFVLTVTLLVVFISCRWEGKKPAVKEQDRVEQGNEEEMMQLVEADKAFSKACAEKGMKKAFLEYLANDAVLLRPDQMPITESDVVAFLSAQEDTSFVMSWEPKGGHIAKSNELGFTYGVYKAQTKDAVLNGTYVFIWQKQGDGSWKVILDSGNSGTGKNEDEIKELPINNEGAKEQ